MKLSIVIPVYRVEDSLEVCVESVLGQEVDGCEVILVDDGSPDRCPLMCDELARRDTRIRVIHQSNQGLSAARNAGIAIAKGEYITFVDSDDRVEQGSYQLLMDELAQHPEYDVLEFPVSVHHGSPKQERLTFAPRIYKDVYDYWFTGRAYAHAYAWNKIYRRQLFDNVRFPVGRVFEDVHTLPQILARHPLVATTDKGLYYYMWNGKGITATAQGNELGQLLDSHVKALEWLTGNNQMTVGQKSYTSFLHYYAQVLNVQMDVYELTGEQPVLPRVQLGWHWQNVKLLVLKIIGIKNICRLNKWIHRRWRRSR